eukprot:TRINITY_DN93393_c0_g1_i1.p1 TRINITY_DN93393_c0_g1~~TRINITY_DN93393_c0_g1_i1.p1  ORF type:complete len:429 (+),score=65.32 TRINITY_DN93393_c0_g1_i1:65-1351(+)
MAGLPLDGINVVELSLMIAAPSAGQLLSDYGADVLKIEPPSGDPQRYMISGLASKSNPDPYRDSPHFYHVNRGKRSIALDLKTDAGMEALHLLLGQADVFVYNYRYSSMQALGLGADELLAKYPRLIICPISGWGLKGPEADKPGYDVAGFWAYSGAAHAHMGSDGYPPVLAPGFGDMATGIAAAGGICAALVERGRTGKGRILTTSLLQTGMHCNSWALSSFLAHGRMVRWGLRDSTSNPLATCYRGKDGLAFWLMGFEADRHWPATVKAVGRDDWLKDERFKTAVTRRKNESLLVRELDIIFASKTRAEWGDVFDAEGVWWAPVLDAQEAIATPQAVATGRTIKVPMSQRAHNSGRKEVRMVAPPVEFIGNEGATSSTSGTAVAGPRRPTPELGEHTEEVLRSLGLKETTLKEVLKMQGLQQRSRL